MAEATFLGPNGAYVIDLPMRMEPFVEMGYFVEMAPNVYEFTEAGREWILEIKRSGVLDGRA